VLRRSFVVFGVIAVLCTSAAARPAIGAKSGGLIAYLANGGRSEDIFVIRPTGTGRRQITRTSSNESCPAWSPDGKSIVAMQAKGDRSWLTVMNSAGRTRWTIPAGGDYLGSSCPSWSPTGSRLAFIREPQSGSFQLAVIGADGRDLRTVEHDMFPFTFRTSVAWSADGREIAYSTYDSALQLTLIVARVDRKSARFIRMEEPSWCAGRCEVFRDAGISWAPAKRIGVVITSADRSSRRLTTLESDGGGQRVASGGLLRVSEWALSPDARRVALVNVVQRRGFVQEQMWLSDSASPVKQIRGLGDAAQGITWSPIGEQLAVSGLISGRDGIYIVDVEKNRARPLVRGAWAPSWQPRP
jgi:Tol biopolymer transport system component